jgi:hypothetical protein
MQASQVTCSAFLSPLKQKSLEWQQLAIQLVKDLEYEAALDAARKSLSLCPKNVQLTELVNVLTEKAALSQLEVTNSRDSSSCDETSGEESNSSCSDDCSCSSASTSTNSKESDSAEKRPLDLSLTPSSCKPNETIEQELVSEDAIAQLEGLNMLEQHQRTRLLLAPATQEQHTLRKSIRQTLQEQLTRLRQQRDEVQT